MNSANTNSILKRTTFAPRNWIAFIAAVMVRLKALAPYALIELILPGGSVMALALWLYRRRKNGVGFGPLPMKLVAFLRLANPLPEKQALQYLKPRLRRMRDNCGIADITA